MSSGFNIVEEFIRKDDNVKKVVFWTRFLWILSFYLFIFYFAKVRLGDILIIAIFQSFLFLILLFNSSYIQNNIMRSTLILADIIFFFWGISFSSIKNISLLLFIVLFIFTCFLARGAKHLFGIALFVLIAIPVTYFQPWITFSNHLINGNIYDLIVLEIFLTMAALFFGFLGILGNPFISTRETLKRLSRYKRLTIEATQNIVSSFSLSEVLENCINSFQKCIPDARIDIIKIKNDKASTILSTGMEKEDDFNINDHYVLSRCIQEKETIISKHGLSNNGVQNIWSNTFMRSQVEEMCIPLYLEDNEEIYCASVMRQDRSFLEVEKEFAIAIGRITSSTMLHTIRHNSLNDNKQDTSRKLSLLEKTNSILTSSVEILNKLNTTDDLKHCFNNINEIFRSVLNHTTLMLFFIRNHEKIELIEISSIQPVLLEKGFIMPLQNTLIEKAIKQNNIIYKNSLSGDSFKERKYDDIEYYLRNNIKSIFIIPLEESSSSTPYGVLVIGGKLQEHFQIENMDFLSLIKLSLGSAVMRSNKNAEIKRKLKNATSIYVVGKTIASKLKTDYLALDIGNVIKQAFNFDQCVIYLFDEKSNQFVATIHEGGKKQRVTAPIEDAGVLSHVYLSKKSYMTGNTLKDPICNDTGSLSASRLVTPIFFNNKLLGIIDVSVFRENAFTPSDIKVMNFVASQVAVSLSNAKLYEEVEKLAVIDSLTGLYNRAYFFQQMEKEIALYNRKKEPFSLIMMDLDNLKIINDTHGHPTGDAAIKIIADVMKSSCREIDIPARLGGDEFGLILSGTPFEKAIFVVNRIFSQLRGKADLLPHHLTVSLGIAACPIHAKNLEELYKKADEALYEAKKKGKNQFKYPENELYCINSIYRRINYDLIFKEITENRKDRNKHAIETIKNLISKMIDWGFTSDLICNIIHQLILRLDYPDKYQSYIYMANHLVTKMSEKLGFLDVQIRNVERASMIYDIGKFAIDKNILYAKRPLQDDERNTVNTHVTMAVSEILKLFPIFTPLLNAVKFHHERWNGSGYPWQLKGKEIPIEARILGVVDVFRALVTDRPYRKAISTKEALQIIISQKGVLFDPDVVEAFVSIVS